MANRVVIALGLIVSMPLMTALIVAADDEKPAAIPATDEQKKKLQDDPFIKKAESTFEAEMKAAEIAFAKATQKARDARLDAYRDQLKAFTKAGDFDKAVACKAALSELEKEVEEAPESSAATAISPNILLKKLTGKWTELKAGRGYTWHIDSDGTFREHRKDNGLLHEKSRIKPVSRNMAEVKLPNGFTLSIYSVTPNLAGMEVKDPRGTLEDRVLLHRIK